MILVIGDVMLDRYWLTDGKFNSSVSNPEVTIKSTKEYAGGAANVANNIASLGRQVLLFGLVGGDSLVKNLTYLLSSKITPYLLNSEETTTLKLRILADSKQLIRIDFENEPVNIKGILPEFILKTPDIETILDKTKVVILSDYKKGALNNVASLISFFKKHYKDIKILVDPKGNDFKKYEGVYLIKPNFQEFQNLVGKCSIENLDVKAKEFLQNYNIENLLITLGNNGMVLYQKNANPVRIKALASEVFDVTGAGDTVLASLGYALDLGLDLNAALELANQTAALAISKVGTMNVSLKEIEHFNKPLINKDRILLTKVECDVLLKKHNDENTSVHIFDKPFKLINNHLIEEFKKLKKEYNLLYVKISSETLQDPYFTVENKIAILKSLKCIDGIVV